MGDSSVYHGLLRLQTEQTHSEALSVYAHHQSTRKTTLSSSVSHGPRETILYCVLKQPTTHITTCSYQGISLLHLFSSVRIKGEGPPLSTSGTHIEDGGFCKRWVCSSCRRNTGANGLPSARYFCHKEQKTGTCTLKVLVSASLTFTTVISE